MATPPKRKMNFNSQQEADKLMDKYKVRISTVTPIANTDQARIFLDGSEIARIKYVEMGGVVKYYDLKGSDFRWHEMVHTDYKRLLSTAQKIYSNAESFTPGLFRTIYLKDKGGFDVATVECTFNKGVWEVQ